MRENQLPVSAASFCCQFLLPVSAASFCCQVAALVPNMLCNFYLVKNHKIASNSATTEAREKKHIFGILKIFVFYICLTKFRNNRILLNKISHRFLLFSE